MNSLEELKKDVEEIKARNRKVELDKAWETSNFRKGLIAVLTYTLMVITMIIIKVENPLVSAIIPALGFLLSTFSIGFLKRWWINRKT